MSPSKAYRGLAWLTFASALLVVIWGGIVRVSGSGLGCPDWPLCNGELLPSLDLATRIEWLHRFLGIAGGLSLAGLVAWTVARYRADRALLWLALLAGALYVFQAVLGGIVVLLELPHTWVTAHFANAEILLGVLTALAIVAQSRHAADAGRPDAATWLGLSAAVATFALLLSGAYVRGADASTACTTWPLCDTGLFGADVSQAIHMLHRVLAAAVAVLVTAACVAAWRRPDRHPAVRPLAALTVGFFVLQMAVGAANPLSGFSALAVGAHPAVASLLWCSLVGLVVVQWRPLAGEGVAVARDMIALTKPAIMSLLLLTAFGAMFLAEQGVPPFGLLLTVLVGGACASGGASALNHYFDRDIDELMRRTRRRPLPARRVSTRAAVGLGLVLNAVAFAVLWAGSNLLAALLALSGTVFYIVVYTLWLKRTTVQNIVIGGAAGAIPPLVGWAAVSGSLDLPAWLLFAIVFFWTPAHFWALALLIRDDYERAMVPMLPVVRGDRATTIGILQYATALIPISILLFVVRAAGPLYLVAAIVLGAVFVWYAVRLVRGSEAHRRALARSAYVYSLLYLALLFVAIMVDSTVRLPL